MEHENDMKEWYQANRHGSRNLYPFQQTVAKGADFLTAMENVDIGGPTMFALQKATQLLSVSLLDQYKQLMDVMSAKMVQQHTTCGKNLQQAHFLTVLRTMQQSTNFSRRSLIQLPTLCKIERTSKRAF